MKTKYLWKGLLFLLVALTAEAKDFEWVKIDALHPTQSCVGMVEVGEKREKIDGLSEKELKGYFRDQEIKVVRGPLDEYYIIDGHHVARAALVFQFVLCDWFRLQSGGHSTLYFGHCFNFCFIGGRFYLFAGSHSYFCFATRFISIRVVVYFQIGPMSVWLFLFVSAEFCLFRFLLWSSDCFAAPRSTFVGSQDCHVRSDTRDGDIFTFYSDPDESHTFI